MIDLRVQVIICGTMSRLDYNPSYWRHLPHIQPPGATFFLTFRLHGSLPQQAIDRLDEQHEQRLRLIRHAEEGVALKQAIYEEDKRRFGRFDALLDAAEAGPDWLKIPAVASLVHKAFANGSGQAYDLIAYCIMPNHVHAVLTPMQTASGDYYSLSRLLHGIKGYSARRANRLLEREGSFWQHESYDHFVRDDAELRRIVAYVVQNPVKAGLVDQWQAWDGTYLKHGDV